MGARAKVSELAATSLHAIATGGECATTGEYANSAAAKAGRSSGEIRCEAATSPGESYTTPFAEFGKAYANGWAWAQAKGEMAIPEASN